MRKEEHPLYSRRLFISLKPAITDILNLKNPHVLHLRM